MCTHMTLNSVCTSGVRGTTPLHLWLSPVRDCPIICGSGGARVFAARGKQVCVAAPPIRSVLESGYFSGFRTLGVWTNFWGPFLYPPFLFTSLPSTLFPFHPPIIPRGVWGGAPAEIEVCAFSLKIWHPVATNLKIFLRIKWPNFTQNFQILCRNLKHLNSAKH